MASSGSGIPPGTSAEQRRTKRKLDFLNSVNTLTTQLAEGTDQALAKRHRAHLEQLQKEHAGILEKVKTGEATLRTCEEELQNLQEEIRAKVEEAGAQEQRLELSALDLERDRSRLAHLTSELEDKKRMVEDLECNTVSRPSPSSSGEPPAVARPNRNSSPRPNTSNSQSEMRTPPSKESLNFQVPDTEPLLDQNSLDSMSSPERSRRAAMMTAQSPVQENATNVNTDEEQQANNQATPNVQTATPDYGHDPYLEPEAFYEDVDHFGPPDPAPVYPASPFSTSHLANLNDLDPPDPEPLLPELPALPRNRGGRPSDKVEGPNMQFFGNKRCQYCSSRELPCIVPPTTSSPFWRARCSTCAARKKACTLMFPRVQSHGPEKPRELLAKLHLVTRAANILQSRHDEGLIKRQRKLIDQTALHANLYAQFNYGLGVLPS